MSAIVLDGHLKSALACVRSLGKKRVEVTCGEDRPFALACHSRFVRGSFVYPSAKKDPDAFVESIVLHAKKLYEKTGEKPVLFSFSDVTFLALARAYEKIRDVAVMPLSSLEAIEIGSDKNATYELARELSIPTIRTYPQEEWGNIEYPAVVKHRHSIIWRGGNAVVGSASFVFSKEALKQAYKDIVIVAGEEPLVMEFIRGDEYGVEMVCKDGEVISEFAHKRIRSLSPRGGAAVVKETAKDTQEVRMMRQYAHALVFKLSWTGPVMVEFKIDDRDGHVLLMEINGRFWGSLPLAVRAGVDFPHLTYTLAQNEMSDFVSRSSCFVRTRHFLGDCKWLFSVLFAHDPLRKMLYPSRLRALYDFKKEFFISKGDIFAWNDPMPAVFEYIDILNKWKSKG